MKKWIVAAGVVAAAVVVVIVVTKPWPKDEGAGASADEGELEQLRALNEKAKEASRKLMEVRAKMKPFDPKAQREPYPKPEPTDEQKAAAEAAEHKHEHGKRDPADLTRHEKANDVVKASEIGVRDGVLARPDTKPRWDAPAPLDWERLAKLFKGFSIGYKMGGDFTEDTVRELHGTAVVVEGAVLPIDPPAGAMKRFWLVMRDVAGSGCMFCTAPSPSEAIYVDASKKPLKLSAEDRKKMYEDVYPIRAVGRLLLGPKKTADGIEYLFGLELKEVR